MPRSLVVLALLVFIVVSSARAAEPPVAAASVVPAGATVVFNIRRDGLSFIRGQLDAAPAMRAELREYLVRTVGVDLTAVDAMAGWMQSLDPPIGAVLLGMSPQTQGDFRGPVVGNIGGTALHALGPLTAAFVPRVGVLVGSEAAVRDAIVALHEPTARAAWLGAFDPAADLEVAVRPEVSRDPQFAQAAQRFGAQRATLVMRHDGRIRLEVAGDAARLQGLQQMLVAFGEAAVERLRQQKEAQSQRDDVLAGVSAIASYHQTLRFWQEVRPKLVGNRVVAEYQMPDLKSSGMVVPMIGIGAAVAIPAVLKYMRRSKTLEARANLARLNRAIAAWATEHKHKALPASTDWTPARGCCGQPNDRCAADAGAWSAPAWRAFDFAGDGSSFYQYRYTRLAGGHYKIEARGDLDCDGKFSSFSQSGSAAGDSGPVQITDELE